MMRPVTPGALAEHLDLRKRVLAGGRVEDEQDVVRRFGVEAAEHAADLGQLVHQMRLVLEPPGGVDDQRVDAGRGRLLDPVEDDPGGVAAFLAGDHRRADAVAPDLQLLDRRGAERVAGGEQDAIILLLAARWPSLPMVVVLPEPLTPMTRMTCGRGKPQISSGLATGARIFSISSARMVRRPRSSSCSKRRAAMASRMRCDASGPRSEAISASSISSSVDGVERLLGDQAGEIVADPLGGLLETRRAGGRASSCPDRRSA